MEALNQWQALGLTLPTPWYIAGSILFGLIGMAAYSRGKKAQHARVKWLGVALMIYPYAVSETWILYAVGSALCVVLWRERV